MKCPDELRQKLWELIFDLLPPEEAEPLRAQIVSDPAVARAYSEARLRADVVATAARQEESRLPLRLPDEEGVFRTEGSGEWSKSSVLTSSTTASSIHTRLLPMAVRWFSGLAALALLAFTVGYVTFGEPWAATAAREAREELAQDYVGIVIAGPPVIEPGGTQNFSVSTVSLDGSAVSTSLVYGLANSRGEKTWEKEDRTDDNGTLQVELPVHLVNEESSLWVEPANETVAPLRANLVANGALDNDSPDATASTRWYRVSRSMGPRNQLDLNVHAARTGNLLVTAESNGRQVAQKTVTLPADESGAKQDGIVSLPLEGRAWGPTRLTVYDYGRTPPVPLGDELFFLQPATTLSIDRIDVGETFAPGAEVQLRLKVQTGDGKPVPANLRVAVVEKSELDSRDYDDAVLELAGEARAPRKDASDAADEILVVSDTPPLVVDNNKEARQAHRQAVAEFDARRESQIRRVGWIITGGGALLLGGLILTAGARFAGDVRWFALKMAACAVCLLVGVVYGLARVDEQGNTALSPFSRQDRLTPGKDDVQLAESPATPEKYALAPDDVFRSYGDGSKNRPAANSGTDPQRLPEGKPPAEESKSGEQGGESSTDAGGKGQGGGIVSSSIAKGGTQSAAGSGGFAPAPTTRPGLPADPEPTVSQPAAPGSGVSFDMPVQQPAGSRFGGRNDLEVKTYYSNLKLLADQNGVAHVTFQLPETPGDFWVFVEARLDNRLGLYRCKISSQAPQASKAVKE